MTCEIHVFRLSNELFSLALSEVNAIIYADAAEAKLIDRIDEFLLICIDANKAHKICERASLVTEAGKLISIVNENDIEEITQLLKDHVQEDTCIHLDTVRGFGKNTIASFLEYLQRETRYRLWKKCSKTLKISYVNGLAILYEVSYKKRQQKFEDREPNKRPCYRPGTMKPQLARVLVNLARVSTNPPQLILDPFCGVGGIALEACLMGLQVICSDLNEKMCTCAKNNLKYFQCDDRVEVLLADATRKNLHSHSVDAIATDPPYGIQSSPVGSPLKQLIKEFINIASDVVKYGGHIVFAIPLELEPSVDMWLLENNFKVKEKHLNMVHGSLTRVIYVAEKK